MPAIINLTAVPGHITREDGYSFRTIEVIGKTYGRLSATVTRIADIQAAVGRLGAQVREAYPDVSFYISVNVARGSRAPNGYDKAWRENGFGQDAYLAVIDKGAQGAGTPPVAELSP